MGVNFRDKNGKTKPRTKSNAKVKSLMGQYVDGPTIRGIAGYDPHELYARVKKGKVPTKGTTRSKRYLVNKTTAPILFEK